MKSNQDVRIWLLSRFLVLLPFLAKISFDFLGVVPAKFWILIFQHGLHPYMNVALSALAGIPLLWFSLKDRAELKRVSIFYRLFIVFTLGALWFQGILQFLFGSMGNLPANFAAISLASFLVILYGWLLPRIWRLDEFLIFVGRWSQVFVVLSLLVWILNPEVTFKGTRFIGIFKHIPYMVTCATLACLFTLTTLHQNQKLRWKAINVFLWLAGFASLLMTGTRSATFAVVLGLLVYIVLLKPPTAKLQFLKFSLVVFAASFVLLFGNQLFDYSYELVRGEQALGGRKAQDGVKARLDEIERGFATFQESPWVGQGLLSKFNAQDSGDLARYDAMKDPHNIFISAGVLGGWLFIILTVWGVVLVTIGSVKALLSERLERRVLAIYVLSHVPILIIYHVHLSLGGLADRVYWLVFGFLAVFTFDSSRSGKDTQKAP